jgi:hypothetical protein
MISIVMIIVILTFFIAGGIVLYLFIKFSEKTSIPPNLPIVRSYIPQFTDGFSEFIELDCVKTLNGNYLVTLIPKDIYLDWKTKKPKKMPQIYKIVVGRDKRIIDYIGEGSSERMKIIYLPDRFDDLPLSIRNSEFGKLLENALEFQKIKLDGRMFSEITDEKVTKLLEKFPHKATQLAVAETEEIIRKFQELSVMEKKEEKPKRMIAPPML